VIVFDILLSILTFVAVLGLLVLVHEFGHYVAGRLQGFGIDAFSIGFGPKLLEKAGRYNLWQVRWLLLGGYVKFRGESGEDEGGAPAGPGELFFKMKRWQRFLVMVMGVVFNVLMAYLLLSGLVMYGVEESLLRDQPPRVGWVAPGLPAERVGIRPGDVLLSIDGQQVANWDEAREDILMLTQKPYAIEASRGGQRLAFTVTPESGTLLKQPIGEIGIAPALPVIVDKVQDPSPALAAGLKPGDKIVALDGVPMTYFDEFQRAMALGQGGPRTLDVERDGQRVTVTVTPEWNPQNKRYVLGIAARDTAWVRYPIPSNFVKAFRMTLDQSTLAYRTIERLVQRKVALSSLSSPVSIAYITGEVAKTGPYNLLMLLAIISLQLGLFNLLPIPGLDGGQILILLVESAVRRDVPMRVKERIVQVGFGLLILLFAVILSLDVVKFFQ
jgi:regulator of sigma E protease